jgi:RNase P subunit RPR2
MKRTTCPKCNHSFSWVKDDALVMRNYGTTCIIGCPQCGKIIKVKGVSECQTSTSNSPSSLHT